MNKRWVRWVIAALWLVAAVFSIRDFAESGNSGMLALGIFYLALCGAYVWYARKK